MRKPEKGKREESLWSYEEDATIFSKLAPVTRYQKAPNFTSQVSLWDPLPQPCVYQAALHFIAHGGPTPPQSQLFPVCGQAPGACGQAPGASGMTDSVAGKRGRRPEQLQAQYFRAERGQVWQQGCTWRFIWEASSSLCSAQALLNPPHPSITCASCTTGPGASTAISCPHFVEMKEGQGLKQRRRTTGRDSGSGNEEGAPSRGKVPRRR